MVVPGATPCVNAKPRHAPRSTNAAAGCTGPPGAPGTGGVIAGGISPGVAAGGVVPGAAPGVLPGATAPGMGLPSVPGVAPGVAPGVPPGVPFVVPGVVPGAPGVPAGGGCSMLPNAGGGAPEPLSASAEQCRSSAASGASASSDVRAESVPRAWRWRMDRSLRKMKSPRAASHRTVGRSARQARAAATNSDPADRAPGFLLRLDNWRLGRGLP